MQRFRLFARVIATVWLVCQAASLAAFVPDHCCISHAAEAAAKKAAVQQACHEEPKPEPVTGEACPMHDGEGVVCPMHSSKSADCSAMKNACPGPGTQLASLFAFVGVMDAPAVSISPIASAPALIAADSTLLYRLKTPDAPPPKA
jgi:hypothetical protein